MNKKTTNKKPINREPSPVTITDEAVPVKLIDTPEKKLVEKNKGTTLAPDTTEQEDITTAGQRKVNLIWEYTQAAVAIIITGAIVYMAVSGKISDQISNAFFLIIGFYFSRTNHQAIGGVGKKPTQQYKGR